jgi:hypothetical protein
MEEKDKSEEKVKVVDRRRFANEEDLQTVDQHKVQPDSRTDNVQEPYSKHKATFSGLLMGLGTQAMVMLGEIPDPNSGTVVKNIEAAKETIDIIGLLGEKTKGNLSTEEQRLLDEILASLRLAFVRVVKNSHK